MQTSGPSKISRNITWQFKHIKHILNKDWYKLGDILGDMNIDISKNYTIFNEKNKNITKTEMKFYLKIEIIWNFVKPYTNNTIANQSYA